MYYICILLSKKHIFKEKVECCEEWHWSVSVGEYLVSDGWWFSAAGAREGQAYGHSLGRSLAFPLSITQLIPEENWLLVWYQHYLQTTVLEHLHLLRLLSSAFISPSGTTRRTPPFCCLCPASPRSAVTSTIFLFICTCLFSHFANERFCSALNLIFFNCIFIPFSHTTVVVMV